jgi:hypothetical protein
MAQTKWGEAAMADNSLQNQRLRNAADTLNRADAPAERENDRIYNLASRLFGERQYDEARQLFASLDGDHVTPSLRASAVNDLAVLDSLDDRHHVARAGFKRALFIDLGYESARALPCLSRAAAGSRRHSHGGLTRHGHRGRAHLRVAAPNQLTSLVPFEHVWSDSP